MDLHTLFFVEASLLFLFGLTMIINSLGQPAQQGMYWFAASNFCGGLGLVLHSALPSASPTFTVVTADLLLFIELTFLNKSIAEFVGTGRNLWRFFLPISAIVTAAIGYFTAWPDNPPLRIQLISIITVSTALSSAILVFRSLSPGTRAPGIVMGTLLALYASTNTIRFCTIRWFPHQSFYHIWLDRTIITGLSFGYLLMTTARLRYDLEKLANTDALTGALNRRAIERETERVVERSRERSSVVAALMLDVDYFKQINDSYGHHAGDLALRAIASCLRETTRKGDLIARLGGDEFLVIMPNTSVAMAQQAAERIKTRLAQLNIATEAGSFGVQASIGVSCLNSSDLKLEDLMKLGDRALYTAKVASRKPDFPSQTMLKESSSDTPSVTLYNAQTASN